MPDVSGAALFPFQGTGEWGGTSPSGCRGGLAWGRSLTGMAPPMNSGGRFEAVDNADGSVVGVGHVQDSWVTFQYGDQAESKVTMTLDEWDNTWPLLPQSKTLTLRAAQGEPPDPFTI